MSTGRMSPGSVQGLSIADAGWRFGIKGPDAPALLQQLGLQLPPRPNSVARWRSSDPWGSGRCLRQGNTEFLVELDDRTGLPEMTGAASLANAWTLIRSDHSLLLAGTHWPRSLARICSYDFAQLQHEPDLVVMTLMAGIGVTLIAEPATAGPTAQDTATPAALRLWCDASFSTYLEQCLSSIGGSR